LGSIFAIWQQQGNDTDGSASDLLQDGCKQIAAGYILYGPSTLVYSIGKGVHSFTLDPSLGEFILSDENIQIPNHGPIYSVNEGNFWQWMSQFGNTSVHRTGLYCSVWAMVGDIHRILVHGVFLYPGTVKNQKANCACSMSLLP